MDYKPSGEWLDNENCEQIFDDADPTVTPVSPRAGSTTKDRTPTISAAIKDSHPRMDIPRNFVRLSVDGKPKTFSFSAATDRLTASPRLDPGAHKVTITAREVEGLQATKSWGFKVKK